MVATRSPQSASCGGVRIVAPAAIAKATVASMSSTQSWKIVLARPGAGTGQGPGRLASASRLGLAPQTVKVARPMVMSRPVTSPVFGLIQWRGEVAPNATR